jgi:pimeloyl-ACP methyl ester carboxylesterase
MVGFEQHVIDLEYAIRFIQNEEAFHDLQISLVGHSWGGYAAAAVLNVEPKISSVVSISGFSSTYDLELDELSNKIGAIGNLAFPYLMLTQLQKFGK